MADDEFVSKTRFQHGRRQFLFGAGVAGTAAALAQTAAEPAQAQTAVTAPAPSAQPDTYLTLTATEVAFFSALADAFIPADALSPSGTDCGVVVFIDRQLAGAWGGGAKMYRAGPFAKGKPELGYQLSLSPREYFAAGIIAVNAWTKTKHGRELDRLSTTDRDAVLKTLESGKAELESFDGKAFFEALLDIAMEGFFSDPIYGGNRDKVSWKMVGFPGLPAVYRNLIVDWRDKRFVVEPKSIADFS